MKKFATIGIVLLVMAGGVFVFKSRQNKNSKTPIINTPINQAQMKIQSPAFLDNENIPSKYTCDGDNINPPLDFLDVPQSAQSLALIISDPDAPMGTWMHWVMWNIAPSVKSVDQNSIPSGAEQGKTSSGQNSYGGPCPPRVDSSQGTTTRIEAGPPSGTHHYIFTLYALDSRLNLPSYTAADDLKKSMDGHVIEEAQLVGLYSRGK